MIAVYLRVSSDLQAENNSVDSQRFALKVLMATRGWDYSQVVEYVDEAVSGSTANREAYQRLRADIQAGTVKRLCTYDMDRISRDPDERSSFVRLCMEKGVPITESVGDLDTATPVGQLMERIMSALSEYQRAQIRERTKAGIRSRIARGDRWGGSKNAGKRPSQKGIARFTPEEVEELKAMYASGIGSVTIAHTYATTNNTVLRTLKRAGVKIRSHTLETEGARGTSEPVSATA